ncbi:unnamed protein product [Prorocentrum cordatum]|uniref:mannose-6-phosphate isomerase n=1 Tax=Prorocentrum cordatum TaxID=2364126 RepID=A0ABN9Q1T1_9DINO|nr:unnamed protein product [Polarella glacialis]
MAAVPQMAGAAVDGPLAATKQPAAEAWDGSTVAGCHTDAQEALSTAAGDSPGQQVAPLCPVAVPLHGVVQHYAWGKPPESSLVALMASEQHVRSRRGAMRQHPLSRGNRFAELWMGTHPNGPSSVEVPAAGEDEDDHREQYLLDTIQSDPAYWLGEEDADRGDLPYLFKVLSVRQALSIQAHPNKKLAEQLHESMPQHYADPNHKPEIAIPLGSFEALCGFRPLADVRRHVRAVPELLALCGDPEQQDLRQLYSKLMRSEQSKVAEQVMALTARLAEKSEGDRTPEEELVLRVVKDYPGDVGLFSIYFLNYVRLNGEGEGWLNAPRQFIYCAPDEPHAYLSGECVECMAISDNVVRAGLTPKFKDVDTLLGMMTYRDDLLDVLVGQGDRVSPGVVKYDPPVPDFMVYEIDGPVPEGLALPHASIVTCIRGSFEVDFRHSGDALFSDAAGPQTMSMGHTQFCRAGTELVALAAGEGARMFVATY